MPDPEQTPLQRLNEDIELWKLRDDNERLRQERDARGGRVSNGGSNGAWAAKAVFQVVLGLVVIMLTAGVGVVWSRGDRHDISININALEISRLKQELEYVKQRMSEEKARSDEMYRIIYRMPATTPQEQRGGR